MNIDGLRPWEVAMADSQELYEVRLIREAWNEGRADGRDQSEEGAKMAHEMKAMRGGGRR